MRTIIIILLSFCLVLFGLVLGGANDQKVTVNFIFGSEELILSHLLLITFISGFAIGSLLLSFKVLFRSLSARFSKKKLEKLESEVTQLRTAPPRENY